MNTVTLIVGAIHKLTMSHIELKCRRTFSPVAPWSIANRTRTGLDTA